MIFPSQYMGKSLLIAVALYALLCAHSAAEPKSNVLCIGIDDLRNALGALGVAHAKTPQLDAFAKTARVFTHHYVQVPTCGASHPVKDTDTPQVELFDYATDPDETSNHAEAYPKVVADLLAPG